MEYNLLNIGIFSLAAMAGACARYFLVELLSRFMANVFPWGTFVVNVVGCFAFGLVWENNTFSNDIKYILLAGFLGAFTTFSSLIFDCHNLAVLKHKSLLILNIFGQLVFGLLAFALAIFLVQ